MDNMILTVLGALGGLAVFVASIVGVIRAIMHQVSATDNNTSATVKNTEAISHLDLRVTNLDRTVAVQGERITNQETEMTRLADAINRNGHIR